MPRKRLSMQRIRAVLRLKHELRRSHREIARALGIANSTVSDYARRALAAGLSCPLPQGLDDAPLEAALFPPLSEGPAAVHAAPSSTTTNVHFFIMAIGTSPAGRFAFPSRPAQR